jgi:Mrp family chromosome partitioning ATPase/capsular polysaccharide biosynthesis protein
MFGIDDPASTTVRAYAGIALRRIWLVLLVVLVATVAAYFYAKSQTPLYTATARMMYVQPVDPTSDTSVPSIDTNSMAIQLQSVTNVIDTPAVRMRAATLLGGSLPTHDFTVTASVVSPSNTVGTTSFPDLVDVSAQSKSPQVSARLANAVANAVIALREVTQQRGYSAAEGVIQGQLNLYVTPTSKLSTTYLMLLQQLTNLKTAEATATGDFEVITPATAPRSPSSPRPKKTAALGLGAGVIMGIAFAFVVGRFDLRVHSHRQVAQVVDLPVIGRVPHLPRRALDVGGLVSMTEPSSAASEAFRMLRSNLEWADIDNDIRTLLVTSCVKGEGKTLTVCNLGVTLARAGKDVVIVDADLRDPRVHRVFNVKNALGLTSVVLGSTSVEDALIDYPSPVVARLLGDVVTPSNLADADPWEGRLRILPAGSPPPNPGEVAASKRMAATLAGVVGLDVDYVLVDTPPILHLGDAGALASSADALVLVVNMDKTRRDVLVRGREVLDALPARKLGVVVVGERIEHREYYRYTRA